MKQASLDNIYNEIMLLSDNDKNKLYKRMKQELHHDKDIIAYTTTGMPLTQKQYIEKIEKSITEADRNELTADNELEKEIATW